jgi:DNA-binding NarL/FixJ family response regulator
VSSAAIRLLVVDDHPLFRAGVVAMLSDAQGVVVAGEAGAGREAIDAFDRLRPDLVLLDLQLPDMEGSRVIGELRRRDPSARVVVLTTYASDAPARRALAAGAQGYLLKTALVDELLSTVHAVYHGQQRITAEVAQELAERQADEALSARELDVLRGAAGGLDNKRIAQRLGLSPDTVKEYLSTAMAKLHATNRAHAVAIALERGFLR